MTDLPTSGESGDLDNLSVTRAEFREEIGVLLEYLAQALGDVGGDYSTEAVVPTAVILQGTPTIEAGARPDNADSSTRIPSTEWVKEAGRYVGNEAPPAPVDGMLWVDNASSPYSLKAYNSGYDDWDLISGFPSGTRMLFQQTAAPVGWTKVTNGVDNMALRVTTGNVGTVSSEQPFSSVFSNKSTGGSVLSHTLTTAQMPSHSHGVSDGGHGHGVSDPGHSHGYMRPGFKKSLNDPQLTNVCEFEYSASTSPSGTGISIAGSGANIGIQSNGSSQGHSHGFSGGLVNLKINYVDVIVAERD